MEGGESKDDLEGGEDEFQTALTADLEKLSMQLDFEETLKDTQLDPKLSESDQAMEPIPAESSKEAQQEAPNPAESSDQAQQKEAPKPTESSDQVQQKEASKPTESSDQVQQKEASKPTESSDQVQQKEASKPAEPSDPSTGTQSEAAELEAKLKMLLKFVQQPASSSSSDVPQVGVQAVHEMLKRPGTLDFEALCKVLTPAADSGAAASDTGDMPPPSFIPVKRETMPPAVIAKALSDAALQGSEAHRPTATPTEENQQAAAPPVPSDSDQELAEQDTRGTTHVTHVHVHVHTHTRTYIYIYIFFFLFY